MATYPSATTVQTGENKCVTWRRSALVTRLLLLWWCLCIILVSSARAQIMAASCEYADVNSAVSSAVTGDTVIIPAGTCTWATTLNVGAKSIVIQGAGAGTQAQCEAGGQITYTCLVLSSGILTGLIDWSMIATGVPEIRDITFDGGGTGGNCSDTDGLLFVTGDTANFLMHDNRLITRRCHGMIFRGSVRGVIWDNIFDLRNRYGAYVNHPGWNGGASTCPNFGSGCGDRSWSDNSHFGTSQFIFFEDNTFDGSAATIDFAVDGWIGQRMVIRYNSILDSTIQDHGTDSVGRPRGARAKEVYRNTWTMTGLSISACTGARGGTGLFWGNEVIESGGTCTVLAVAAHFRLTTGPVACAYWGCCDDPVANDWDQGSGTSNGYACLDQTGRGVGDLLTGNDPPTGWPNQALEPLYAWDNNVGGSNNAMNANVSKAGYLAENIDFYTEGSLNGAMSGPIASRPATCTPTQSYWATDEGEWDSTNGAAPDGRMYLCLTTNTWTLGYGNAVQFKADGEPYDYPHPLRAMVPAPAGGSPERLLLLGIGE